MHDDENPEGKGEDGGAKGGGKHRDVSHMDIADVVEKHGPAHQVHIQHDHDGGTHQVATHHGDTGDGGHHVHKSKHKSVKAAHEHAMRAAGEEHEGTDEDEATPFAGEETADEEEAEHGIPGLSD